MLNPKTGTVWTPDIRPDKIETFEEIYTSEGGEQQAITYKIVDNHPILNKVLDKFAFFKTHVSAIWYNKLANITLKQKLDEMDAGIQDVSVKMPISQSSLLNSINGIKVNNFSASRRGHIIEFYMSLESTLDSIDTKTIFKIKSPYTPLVYSAFSIRGYNSPYKEIGTLWIDESGKAAFYGTITLGTRFYLQGLFVY